jgi:flagellar protein FliS
MSEIAAAGPDRETVMLYDEAIAALGEAIAAIAADDIEARCTAICAATEAITTLYLNLDIRRCGETADDLADLYGHVLGRLIGVNLYNDPEIAREVIELLEPLRHSWTAPNGMITASAPLRRPARVANNGGSARTSGTALAPGALAEAGNSS